MSAAAEEPAAAIQAMIADRRERDARIDAERRESRQREDAFAARMDLFEARMDQHAERHAALMARLDERFDRFDVRLDRVEERLSEIREILVREGASFAR